MPFLLAGDRQRSLRRVHLTLEEVRVNRKCGRKDKVQVGVGEVVARDDAGQNPQALDAPPLLPVRQLPLRLLTHAIPSLFWGSERREGVALAGAGDVYSDRKTIIRSVGVSVVI